MASEAEAESTMVAYDLFCTACSFRTTVDGTFVEALDLADAHQDEYGASATDHFVNIERRGDPTE